MSADFQATEPQSLPCQRTGSVKISRVSLPTVFQNPQNSHGFAG